MTLLFPSSLARGISLLAWAKPEAPVRAGTALASFREAVVNAAAALNGTIAVAGLTISLNQHPDPIVEKKHRPQATSSSQAMPAEHPRDKCKGRIDAPRMAIAAADREAESISRGS